MTLQDIFDFVARLYGIQTIFEHAAENDIEISYYVINKSNELILAAGNELGESIVPQNIGPNIQGLYQDNQRRPNCKGTKYILLSLRENLLPKGNEMVSLFVEMMIIHELAHFIDQQDLLKLCGIQLTDCDLLIGKRIENEAQVVADRTLAFPDSFHNQRFGAILNHLISLRYEVMSPEFIRKSMSRTLIDPPDIGFYRC